MYEFIGINDIRASEILDSRGMPTVRAEVLLEDGTTGAACVPSGASTGKYEAVEKRDEDHHRFHGTGVLKACGMVNKEIRNLLRGRNVLAQQEIDRVLKELDDTQNFSYVGANAALAVSLACARAAAEALCLPLYQYIGGLSGRVMPVPMMNVINGGKHAGNNIDIQEFMIMPTGARTFAEGYRWCAEVYQSLRKLLMDAGMSVSVGDEGGFAPDLKDDMEACELICRAIEHAGFKTGKHFVLALDAAASEWQAQDGYRLPKRGQDMTRGELIEYWKKLCATYPVQSIEDPLGQDDFEGFEQITQALPHVQIVGDDLFVTNPARIARGGHGIATTVLIKPNQIGTLSLTLKAVDEARRRGMNVIVSHRSGETCDSFIADLAVAVNAGQIKAGAPCRSERTEKYNRLTQIAYELGAAAEYGGVFDHLQRK